MNRKTIIILLALIVSSCSVWENFTTYFNIYFNASKIFDDVEEQMALQIKDRFEFRQIDMPQNLKQQLNKVIEKCSKILQFHSESGYVDDALLMIGKSFYYQKEYSKAFRKFSELAARENSPYALESQLWLGKTELQLRNFEVGFNILEELKKSALLQERPEIGAESAITQVSYLINRENYVTAIDYARQLIDLTDDPELKAETAYQIGKLHLLQGDTENAALAFAEVSNYEPVYEVEFNSKIENARLRKLLKKTDESMELLEELRSDKKNSDKYDLIDYEIALIHYEQGDIEKAMQEFTVIDTTYKRTASAGEAAFLKGEIWDKYYNNYDSALFYYDKSLASQMEPIRKEQAKKKSELLNKYITLSVDYQKNTSSYYYVTDPAIFTADSLLYEERIFQDTSKTWKLQNEPAEQPPVKKKQLIKPMMPTLTADSLKSLVLKSRFELGNLFLTELNVPDSAYKYYLRIAEEDSVLNFKPKFYYTFGTYYLTVGNQQKADSLFSIVYSNYRFDPLANEAAKKLGKETIEISADPAAVKYRAAEALMIDKNYPEAIATYFQIYKEHTKSNLAARSLYTIGYLYENELKQPDSAAAYYDSLTSKYQTTDYARSVLPKLNVYRQERKRLEDSVKAAQKKIADSLAQIEKAKQAISDSIAAAEQAKSAPNEVSKDSLQVVPDSLNNGVQPSGFQLEQDAVPDSSKSQDNPGISFLPEAIVPKTIFNINSFFADS